MVRAQIKGYRQRPLRRLAAAGFGILGLIAMDRAAWAQAAAAPPPSTPILTKAAQAIGVKRCLPAIAQTSEKAAQGATKQDILVDWDHQAPDNGPLFSLTGSEYGALTMALSLTAIPDAQGGCAMLAERISSAPMSCSDLAKRELSGYAATPLLSSVMVYTRPQSPGETITLVNAPPSCLVIRRQVKYHF